MRVNVLGYHVAQKSTIAGKDTTMAKTLYEQSQTRSTLDKIDMQTYVKDRMNDLGVSISQRLHNRLVSTTDKDLVVYSTQVSTLESVLHEIGGYSGFQSRAWEAFVCQEYWLDIVRALQDYDDTHDTSHYWKLLKILDWRLQTFAAPRVFYGNTSRPCLPTTLELARAKRIRDHYAKWLGIA